MFRDRSLCKLLFKMAYVRFYHWSGRKRRQRGKRRQSIEHRKKHGSGNWKKDGSGNWKEEEKKIDVH